MTLTNLFSDIANAIRAKTGGTDPIVAADFPAAIAGISGGGEPASMIVATIPDDMVDGWGITSITVPELVGAKYFVVEGNPFNQGQITTSDVFDEAGKIIQLVYLDGVVLLTSLYMPGTQSGKLYVESNVLGDGVFSFDSSTGTLSNYDYAFGRIYGDTSTTGNAYTVYRIS